jgi:hypothetical protein
MDDRNWTINQVLESDYYELMDLYSEESANQRVSLAQLAKII